MRRERIAICGGGMGGLTAAFELTSLPDWQRRYEVTVYQSGWLLGGKGASVRNRRAHDRVEEHGLHVWMGCYDNAFDVVRRCYEELARDPGAPLATWEQAFLPQDFVVLEERVGDAWKHWRLDLPRNSGLPGGRVGEDAGTFDGVQMALEWMQNMLIMWARQDEPSYRDRRHHVRELARDLNTLAHGWNISAAAAALSLRRLARTAAGPGPGPVTANVNAQRVADALAALMHGLDRRLLADEDPDLNARWLWFAIDFVAAHVIGLLRDGLVDADADFGKLEGEDYRAWLRRHGASQETVDAPPIRSVYTLMFSHDDGIAASVAVPGMLRMILRYKGAAFYKMRAGMGETIFGPLYEVLARRGVRFEFFHQLRHLGLSEDGRDVERLVFGRQATVHKAPYQPLVEIDGLPCWPDEPLYEQLVEGEALRDQLPSWSYPGSPCVEERTLWLDRDFDRVILAVPVPALPSIVTELTACDQRWKDLLANVRSIPTQAMQLWFDRDLANMGWEMPGPILGTYAAPYDTWCDMTHLLEIERWHEAHGPKAVGYFCGQYGTSADAPCAGPEEAVLHTAAAQRGAVRWLDEHAAHLFPLAAKPGVFDWTALHGGISRDERIQAQYFRANVAPSDRYVLSAPGTGRFRLAPHDSGFENLALAGDWTRTGLDGGAIEAAAMSGKQAARAVHREPVAIPGEPPSFTDAFRRDVVAGKPRFVERSHDLVLPPPYTSNDCRMHSFFLGADMRKLRALCDRLLNTPSGGAAHYVPAAPFVILACAFIPATQAGLPVGGIPEIDIAFWVPVRAVRGGGRKRSSLAWLMPYVFVDTSVAAAIGREVYGFPKVASDIVPVLDERGLVSLDVDTLVLDRFAPTSVATKQRVLTLRRTREARAEPGFVARLGLDRATVSRIGANFLDFAQRGVDRSLEPAAPRLGATVPIVLLKQFRDAVEPSRACHQAIIEVPTRLTGYRGSRWYGPEHTVEISAAASMPIVADLGLGGHTLSPLLSAVVDFDFSVGAGREVWRADAALPGKVDVAPDEKVWLPK